MIIQFNELMQAGQACSGNIIQGESTPPGSVIIWEVPFGEDSYISTYGKYLTVIKLDSDNYAAFSPVTGTWYHAEYSTRFHSDGMRYLAGFIIDKPEESIIYENINEIRNYMKSIGKRGGKAQTEKKRASQLRGCAAMNKRTPEERAEAAKKGWEKRKGK